MVRTISYGNSLVRRQALDIGFVCVIEGICFEINERCVPETVTYYSISWSRDFKTLRCFYGRFWTRIMNSGRELM